MHFLKTQVLFLTLKLQTQCHFLPLVSVSATSHRKARARGNEAVMVSVELKMHIQRIPDAEDYSILLKRLEMLSL